VPTRCSRAPAGVDALLEHVEVARAGGISTVRYELLDPPATLPTPSTLDGAGGCGARLERARLGVEALNMKSARTTPIGSFCFTALGTNGTSARCVDGWSDEAREDRRVQTLMSGAGEHELLDAGSASSTCCRRSAYLHHAPTRTRAVPLPTRPTAKRLIGSSGTHSA